VHAYYCGLPNDIRILVQERNDLSLIEMYKMVEKANQELEVRCESQLAHISSYRFSRYECGAPRDCPQRGEWRDKKNDHSWQDSHQQFNDKLTPSNNRNNESAIIAND